MTMNQGKSQGAKAKAPAAKQSFSLIGDEKLASLYTTMVKCRMLDKRLLDLFGRGNFRGKYDSAAGQEATILGVSIDLLHGDTIAPSPCAAVANLARGFPLEKVLNQLNAEAKDCIPANMGYASLIASGVALGNKLQGNHRIVVAFCVGQAASGAWRKSLQFAAARKLPILFVCYSKAGAKGVAIEPADLDFPCIPVDRNDVVAVYRVASEAIAHARKGNGPTLIECIPYQLCNAPSKDSKAGSHRAGRDDPILKMEKYLAGKGLFHDGLEAKIAAGFKKELGAAVKEARKSSRNIR